MRKCLKERIEELTLTVDKTDDKAEEKNPAPAAATLFGPEEEEEEASFCPPDVVTPAPAPDPWGVAPELFWPGYFSTHSPPCLTTSLLHRTQKTELAAYLPPSPLPPSSPGGVSAAAAQGQSKSHIRTSFTTVPTCTTLYTTCSCFK